MTSRDRDILRELARQVVDIAALPVQSERRELWKQHNSLRSPHPMILVFPEGSWVELLTDRDLQCEGDEARAAERALRRRIYGHEHFKDDTVVEREWVVHKVIRNTGWGLEVKRVPSTTARGAWKFDPVILEASDLKKLRFPEITHDEGATEAAMDQATDLFGDILDVRLNGVDRVAYHLMSQYTDWRGLEEMMVDMCLEPQMLHDAMAFLEEGHHRILKQHIDQNLLSLNNDSTYNSTGGNGYTDELPASGFDPEHVRPCDLWANAEAQELAQVGPEQHAEFAMQYEKRLLEPFGLTGYGCCEDLSRKMDDVFTIPGIRRISISPFADVDVSARKLRGNYIYSWKPRPWDLTDNFHEERIRGYLRHTIEVALDHGCVLEMILKDTHTCEHHVERFDRWTEIAREEVDRVTELELAN